MLILSIFELCTPALGSPMTQLNHLLLKVVSNWGGAKLTDVLKLAGLDDPIEAQEKQGMEHVRFYALDEMTASIGIEKAMNPYGDGCHYLLRDE